MLPSPPLSPMPRHRRTCVFTVVHAEDDEWAAQQIAGWAVPNVEAVQISSPFVEVRGGSGEVEYGGYVSVLAATDRAASAATGDLPADADIIVLHDIADLWRSDLKGAALGGVVDIGLYVKLNRRGSERQAWATRSSAVAGSRSAQAHICELRHSGHGSGTVARDGFHPSRQGYACGARKYAAVF